jgi:hypothetical protein
MNYDKEKALQHDQSASDITPQIYHEDLHEPPKEISLHRGLKARQISMIAVCVSVLSSQNFGRDFCHSSAALLGQVLSSGQALRSGEEGHLVFFLHWLSASPLTNLRSFSGLCLCGHNLLSCHGCPRRNVSIFTS